MPFRPETSLEMIGQSLLHYRILEKLGAGGMGEVYKAEDTRLKRLVALKVLPAEMAASQERLQRFQREAELVASLNHPGIVTIYSVEESAGVHFLTMELVVGKTLADLIPARGVTVSTFLELGGGLDPGLGRGARARCHPSGSETRPTSWSPRMDSSRFSISVWPS